MSEHQLDSPRLSRVMRIILLCTIVFDVVVVVIVVRKVKDFLQLVRAYAKITHEKLTNDSCGVRTAPLWNGALSHRPRPLGQTVLAECCHLWIRGQI